MRAVQRAVFRSRWSGLPAVWARRLLRARQRHLLRSRRRWHLRPVRLRVRFLRVPLRPALLPRRLLQLHTRQRGLLRPRRRRFVRLLRHCVRPLWCCVQRMRWRVWRMLRRVHELPHRLRGVCLQLHGVCLQLHARTVRTVHGMPRRVRDGVHVMPRLLRDGRQVWLHRGHHQMRVLSDQGWMPGIQKACGGHLLCPVQVKMSRLHRMYAEPHLWHVHRLCR